MKTDKIIRIRWDTYKRIRRCFPSNYGESLAQYFNRLSCYLETYLITSEIAVKGKVGIGK